MCGVAGVFCYSASAPGVDRKELIRIRDAMAPRGPDGAGLWLSKDERTGLAHRRLAILDPSPLGAQPMSTADARLHITFNGEIYNYRALRKELERSGCIFRSESDTEVLLHLYAERGAEMVHALRGMYAFAIYDDAAHRLFVARDPFGIKPLYYADDGSTLRFASQVKALLLGNGIDTTPEPAGHVGFYVWGCVPDPYTLYRGVRALPAGTTMMADAHGCRSPQRFFDIQGILAEADDPPPVAQGEATERIHAALRDSVRHHLVSDVPVGLFLSSGLDSTTIGALTSEIAGEGVRSITLAFDEYRGTARDEAPLAERVAERYGMAHRTRRIGRAEFLESLGRVLDAMDQPSIDGVNTYFVSRAAAECGLKVALSGVGGDELFGGYPSFVDVPRMTRWMRAGQAWPRLGRTVRALAAPLLPRRVSPKYASMAEYGGSYGGAYLLRRALYMPWELKAFLEPDFVEEGWNTLETIARLDDTVARIRTPRSRVSALELSWYMRNQLLRDADWAGMAHSLEIRVPLVDVGLFRTVAALSASGVADKPTMAASPKKALPDEILKRPKTGFTVPTREWMSDGGALRARGLRGWAHTVNPPIRNGMTALALATDAFGGRGGIAKFNRDLLSALCAYPGCRSVIAIPRLLPDPPGALPAKLTYLTEGTNGKLSYVWTVLKTIARGPRFETVFCLHINLMPLAWLASLAGRRPIVLVVHGIDAWQPTRSAIANALVKRIDAFIAVSELTRDRFVGWAHVARSAHIVPNCVDLETFHPAPRNADLMQRYALGGKTVLMTIGRLAAGERYKGVDEVVEAMPALMREFPNLCYMVVGEGDDRTRLEQKAADLGIREQVIFTGFIPEDEKCAHLNLADAFVMPSRGEGFGIVLLEAMACGVPVVASKLDGGKEALRGGMLGTLVDPTDSESLKSGIRAALAQPRAVPAGLEYFSEANFRRRAHHLMDSYAHVVRAAT